jgi:hypothetical protein
MNFRLQSVTVSHLLHYRYLIEEVKEKCHRQMHQRPFITRYQSHQKKHSVCFDISIQQGEGTSHLVSMNPGAFVSASAHKVKS